MYTTHISYIHHSYTDALCPRYLLWVLLSRIQEVGDGICSTRFLHWCKHVLIDQGDTCF